MATVQCSGCHKTTTEDQLRGGLCGLCVYDRDKAKYSAENAELEAASRSRQRRAQFATAMSIFLTVAGVIVYVVMKYLRYRRY